MTDLCDSNLLVEWLPRVTALASEAGCAILGVYQDPHPPVKYKADHSPVTQADLLSHRILQTGLARLTPSLPVLSEEAAEVPFGVRRSWQRFWMIDPLDGTREFLQRTGEFTVNVALIEKNRPVLGVVYAPALDQLYFAARGMGAYRRFGPADMRIHTAGEGTEELRYVVSRCHSSEQDMQGRACRVMGSSLKFCVIAEGSADVYPREGPTMEWDTAAAQCILEEAGGSVTDLQGEVIRYNKRVLVNPGFVARGGRRQGIC